MYRQKKLEEFGAIQSQLIQLGANFKVTETSYTKRIKKGKSLIMFSDNPMNPVELKLINKIRSSADTFEQAEMDEAPPPIEFYKFYDTKNEKQFEGIKIDLSQAYWQAAINLGLVTPEIQAYFLANQSKLGDKKAVKMARLRALGALATKKVIREYKDGVLMDESLKVNEAHRQLYLYICEQVADVMQNLAIEFIENVIYYYWDCIFLDDKVDLDQVMKRVDQLGYDCHIEGKGRYSINKQGAFYYLHDHESDVKYPIKKEHII